MKLSNLHSEIFAAICIASTLFTCDCVYAARDAYHFPRLTQTNILSPYSSTVYTSGDHNIYTFSGAELHNNSKDTITSFQVSPTGVSFFVVEKGKKKSTAQLYSTSEKERSSASFDVKKFGVPVCAVYYPDARQLAIATSNNGILIADSRKLQAFAKLPKIPAVPTEMIISPNAYFLAAVCGEKCYIFNLEQKTLRTTIDAGERITDVAFSPNNDDMGILTADGVLSIYNVRTFDLRKMVDDLGDGLAFDYNLDGKYVGVATSTNEITIVNLLNNSDRDVIDIDGNNIADIKFISDADNNTIMAYGMANAVDALRMHRLKPFYNRLIADETDKMMDEWLKMMPGETMDQYKTRISDEARAKQRAMFEYEISTELAGNLLAQSNISVGSYDRANQILAVELSNMPTIFIPVPENEVTAFSNSSDISIDDVLFGIMPDDSFEIVYAKVNNKANGKSYIYDNLERKSMNFIQSENMISIEVLQQQQMEELKLQELREQVLREAKQANVISDHTNISVNSRVVPDYDADGNNILNYEVNVTYEVEPGFSAQEDFGPGKYHINESGAASSMAKIVKEAFEGDLKQYFDNSKSLRVKIVGSADATPILNGINYDGSFGDFEDEPVYVDGQLSALSIAGGKLMKENPQLAFARALSVKDYLEKSVAGYNDINKNYRYEVNVSQDKGSEFRRITATFTFVDAFK